MNKKVKHQFKKEQKKRNKINQFLQKDSSKNKSDLDKNKVEYASYLDEKNPYYEKIVLCFVIFLYCKIPEFLYGINLTKVESDKINVFLIILYFISFLIPIIRLTKFYFDLIIPKKNLYRNFINDVIVYYIIWIFGATLIFTNPLKGLQPILFFTKSILENDFLKGTIIFSWMFAYSGIMYFNTLFSEKKYNFVILILQVIVFSYFSSILYISFEDVWRVLSIPKYVVNTQEYVLSMELPFSMAFIIIIEAIYMFLVSIKYFYKNIYYYYMDNNEDLISLSLDVIGTVLLTLILLFKEQGLFVLLLGLFFYISRYYKFKLLHIVNIEEYFYSMISIIISIIIIYPTGVDSGTVCDDTLALLLIVGMDLFIWYFIKNNKAKFSFSRVKMANFLSLIVILNYQLLRDNIFLRVILYILLSIILLGMKPLTKDEYLESYSENMQTFLTTCVVFLLLSLFSNNEISRSYGIDNLSKLVVYFSIYVFFPKFYTLLAKID